MKKIIFCICLLIGLLLTTQVVTFAQSEEKNIKDTYVGEWHDAPRTEENYSKAYFFKEDGTFVYGTNTKKREGNGDLLYLDGTWAIQNHLLTLETTGKVIEENGKNKYIKLESPQITQYNITVPKETDELLNINSTAKTTINGLQYWKFPEGSRGDDMFEDYKRLTSALNAENFCGNWNQTYVYLQTNTLIGKPISLIITDQKDGKFKFKFEAPQIVGIYRLEREAIINSNHTAYFINKQNGDEYVALRFTKEKDYIDIHMTYSDQHQHIYPNNNNWAENDEIRGRYIQGTPEYIDYKSEIFEDKKIEQKVKNLIGEKAFEQMIFIMDRSYDHWIWRPEQKKTTYSGVLEEKDMKVELLITDKYIYCLGYNLEKENWVLYTNNKNYKNSVPKFFELYDNATIEYVYKEI